MTADEMFMVLGYEKKPIQTRTFFSVTTQDVKIQQSIHMWCFGKITKRLMYSMFRQAIQSQFYTNVKNWGG